jgi:competence protein ComEC
LWPLNTGQAGQGGMNMGGVSLLLGWVLGIGLQLQQSTLGSVQATALVALGSGGLAGILLLCVRARGRHVRLCTLGLCLAGAGLGWSWAEWRAIQISAQVLDHQHEGQDVRIEGEISAMPQRTDTGWRFRFNVHAHDRAGALPSVIWLSWWGGVWRSEADPSRMGWQPLPPELQAGQRWALTVRLKRPHGTRNPGGFDHELWLWEQGVGATGYVRQTRPEVAPFYLGQGGGYWFSRWRQRWREMILARMPPSEQQPGRWGVVAALAMGEQSSIERADWDIFRLCGVAHLMSISGLHITLFAGLAMHLVRRLWRLSPALCLFWPAPHAGRLFGVLLATVYALLTGWGIPAQRTVIMLALMVAARLAGVRYPWPVVWLVALTLVSAMDPWAMLQAGFWLSFVAVAMLMLLGTRTEPAGAPPTRWGPLRGLMREQWWMGVVLAPLGVLFFQQISLIGFVANLLAIPWVTWVITPLALAGLVMPDLWALGAAAVGVLMTVLRELSAFSWATLEFARGGWALSVLATIGAAAMVWPGPWHVRLLGLPVALAALMVPVSRPPVGEFEVLAFDVGQGTAILVQTRRRVLLFDAGPRYGPDSDAGHRVLVPALRALGVWPDLLVLSHRDSDHTGGFESLRRRQVDLPVLTSMAGVSGARWCQRGQHWHWDGVDFDVLHPQAPTETKTQRPNAMSCVLRVSNGQRALLLTGDIEQAQEADLVQAVGVARLRADVLQVPHHGSKTSSSGVFLQAVAPSVGLVQAGYRNRFGHPAIEVVQRYQALGIALVRSDECGAWRWRSDQPLNRPNQCERLANPRYWQHAGLSSVKTRP